MVSLISMIMRQPTGWKWGGREIVKVSTYQSGKLGPRLSAGHLVTNWWFGTIGDWWQLIIGDCWQLTIGNCWQLVLPGHNDKIGGGYCKKICYKITLVTASSRLLVAITMSCKPGSTGMGPCTWVVYFCISVFCNSCKFNMQKRSILHGIHVCYHLDDWLYLRLWDDWVISTSRQSWNLLMTSLCIVIVHIFIIWVIILITSSSLSLKSLSQKHWGCHLVENCHLMIMCLVIIQISQCYQHILQ